MRSLITIMLLLLSGLVSAQVVVINNIYNNVNITREVRCTKFIYTEQEYEDAVLILFEKMQFYTQMDAVEYLTFVRLMGQRGMYNELPNQRLRLLVEDTNWWFRNKYWNYGR